MFYELSLEGYHSLIWKKILPIDWTSEIIEDIIVRNTASLGEVTDQPHEGLRFLCFNKDFEEEFLYTYTEDINPNTDLGMDKLYVAAEEFVHNKKIYFSDTSITVYPRTEHRNYLFVKLIGNNHEFLNDIINHVGAATANHGDIIYPLEHKKALTALQKDIKTYLNFYSPPETLIAKGLCDFYINSYNAADDYLNGGPL